MEAIQCYAKLTYTPVHKSISVCEMYSNGLPKHPPAGWRVIGFRPPKYGDYFLPFTLTEVKLRDRVFDEDEPRLIMERIPRQVYTFTEEVGGIERFAKDDDWFEDGPFGHFKQGPSQFVHKIFKLTMSAI